MKFREITPYLTYSFRLNLLSPKSLNSRNLETEIPAIVSLTTIPSRIRSVHLTIRSILAQTRKPKRVVLWLNDSFIGNIPSSLKNLEDELFQIHYTPHDFSHLKLIESIKLYPNDHIVTVDDDLMYPEEFLEMLYKEHLDHPNDIMTNEGRIIEFFDNGPPKPYLDWPHIYDHPKEDTFVLQLGVFGVWYPPKSLSPLATDSELIKKLAPKADDLWFKALSLINKTKVRLTAKKPRGPVLILGTQKIALKRSNKFQDYNRVQWEQLMRYFKIESNMKI